MLGDIDHREVVGTKAGGQAAESEASSSACADRRRAGQAIHANPVAWAPISGSVPCRTRATQQREDEGEVAEFRDHGFVAWFRPGRWRELRPASVCSVRLRLVGRALVRVADGLGGFRRHVVLVVLGQHFAGGEAAVIAELALGDDAFAFLEQVGQDALVGTVMSLSVSVTTKRR
jgi:hypothetical protein